MEHFKQTNFGNKYNISTNDNYLIYFDKALKFARDNYSEDLDRIANTKFSDITSDKFFSEYVWCVMVSGFRAKTVSKLWPVLTESLAALYKTLSGEVLEFDRAQVATSFLKSFNNKRKFLAILKTYDILIDGIKILGWETFKNTRLDTQEKLRDLPFIGPVLSQHLYRNCGHLDTIKEDLHLVRIANHWGFDNPINMCKEINKKYDFPLGIIDTVLFYSLSTFGSNKY